MASLRPDVGLVEEPPAEHTSNDAHVRTGEWVTATGAPAGPTFPLAHERAAPCPNYSDISAFRDLTQLHQGRHSTVWSAVCQQSGRTVVIKGYNRDSLKPRQLHNVRREINLLQFFRDVGCKGVVGLLSVFEDKSMVYLVFEACMRGDLYQLLMRNRGTLHEEFVVTKIVFPLLCVLQQLHKLHIVHRDIKPENIFVCEDGDIALGDFGLAGHKFQDRMAERVGTLDYMAPEVLSLPTHDDQEHDILRHAAEGAKSYDEKVDIWATGVLVYELLVGRPPFEVDDPQETARLIMTCEANNYPVHISQLARDFVGQALTKAPGMRPGATELLHHPWLRHHFGGEIPDPSEATGSGVTAGLLKSWLMASWSDLSKAGTDLLKPNSLVPNRTFLSPSTSPRKALSTGDNPCAAGHLDDDVKAFAQYNRKSVPGSSDSGSIASPADREMRKQMSEALRSGSCLHAEQLNMLPEPADGDAGGLERDRDTSANRLAASQYPSRDSSTGSMDQAVPMDRMYVRNDSGASASSGVSIASFASLQHVPRCTSTGELAEQDDLGMVQRSASMCPANIGRAPTSFPGGSPQLKPVWQSNTPLASVGSRKTPGKSRFAG